MLVKEVILCRLEWWGFFFFNRRLEWWFLGHLGTNGHIETAQKNTSVIGKVSTWKAIGKTTS